VDLGLNNLKTQKNNKTNKTTKTKRVCCSCRKRLLQLPRSGDEAEPRAQTFSWSPFPFFSLLQAIVCSRELPAANPSGDLKTPPYSPPTIQMPLSPLRYQVVYANLVRLEDLHEQSRLVDAIRRDIDALTQLPGQEWKVTQLRRFVQGDEESPFLWEHVIHGIGFLLTVEFTLHLQGNRTFTFQHTRSLVETYFL
jgi:hypothetical protein